jgi:hypothetical protein
MNSLVHTAGSTSRRSTAAAKLATMLALGIASIALIGSVTPADAQKGSSQRGQYRAAPANLTPLPPVVRDHRTEPLVRDHRGGTVVRDHRAGSAGTGRRSRKVPCLGNLCGVKICTASVCF